MCQLHCGLGMEEHLVKHFLGINLMEVNKLVDLNNLRTAPKLTYRQEKKTFRRTRSKYFLYRLANYRNNGTIR